MDEGYTHRLTEFCSDLKYHSIPSQVIEKTKWAILDNLGVIIGGSVTSEGKRIAGFVKDLGDREEATALGFGFKSSMRNTAFLNGTLSEVIELQDGYTKGALHPCCGVISAALAAAEYYNKGGRDLISSIVAGYEVGNRVGDAMSPSHQERGFLPTGTVGGIGAAAGVGKVMGLDRERMFNAVGIAGFILPVSTGDNLWGCYTIKPIHGGAAAKTGVESAMLALRGYTACALEGDPRVKRGFCSIVSDTPAFERMTDGLGERYTISDIYFKPYACCRIIHGPVEIILDLREHQHLKSDDVESIVIKTYGFAASMPGQIRTNPESDLLHCQFSMPYCVAIALIDGQVGLEQFRPERVKDPKIHELAGRVNVIADSEMERLRPSKRPCIVEVKLKNGSSLVGRVDYPKGDPKKPLSDEQLLRKFESNASYVLNDGKIQTIISMVMEIEKVKDVRELVRLCF
jgi:2-methylcitrate dehydratase PrpD